MEDNKYPLDIVRGHSELNDSIFDWLLPRIEGKMLDIGANGGYLMSQYKGESKGVDLSSLMVQKAKSKGLDVIQANAYNLPFKDKEFDTAVLSCVIEQCEHPYRAIKEAIRVSKKVIGVSPIPLMSQWGFVNGWVRSVTTPEELKKKYNAEIDYFTKSHFGFVIVQKHTS